MLAGGSDEVESVRVALAKVVIERGGPDLFALMSDDTAKLLVEISQLGARIVSTRHENGAVGAADGFSRATGKVGTAMIGRGPGITNAINSLVTAMKAHSRIVVIIGESGTKEGSVRFGKDVLQDQMLDALGIVTVSMNSPATAVQDLVRAYEIAESGTPVVVSLASRIEEEPAGSERSALSGSATRLAAAAPADEINDVCDLLETSWACQRPVILAGLGAVRSNAGPDLMALGDRIGAVFGTTLPARSLFQSSERNIDIVGTFSSGVAAELLGEADVVLAFGASLNENTTYRNSLFGKALVVQIDVDPSVRDRFTKSQLFVDGDARDVARAILAELEARQYSSGGFKSFRAAERIAEFQPTHKDVSEPGALDPRTLMSMLNLVLPAERNVVIDPGHHFAFDVPHLAVREPRAFVAPLEYGAVGSGMGPAIGTAIGRPDVVTVFSVGDGGLMMTLGDLDTAVRYKLNMIVIVNDDGGFGSEVHYLRTHGLPEELALYDNPSFASIARAMGADSLTIETLDDVAKVAPMIDTMSGPLVLDCKISREVRGDWVDFFFGKRMEG